MISLYLLTAHLVGDYLFQNRWMARRKLTDWRWRTYHVTVYCIPFVLLVAVYAHTWTRGIAFLTGLYVLHWLTDSHIFRSTFGDFVHWHLFVKPEQRRREMAHTIKHWDPDVPLPPVSISSLPPNTWPLVSSAVDQTLHLVQIAVLAAIFLG